MALSRLSLLAAIMLASSLVAFAAETEVAAGQGLPVPEVVTKRIETLKKIITVDTARCADELKTITSEINKHTLEITKYESRKETVTKEVKRDEAQLDAEIVAIQQVKTMVVTALKRGSSPTSTEKQAASESLANLDTKSKKVATVLSNIVESMGANRDEYAQVIQLLDSLIAKIKTAKGHSVVSSEVKVLEDKIAIEREDIAVFTTKKQKVTAQCLQRHTELEETLTVLTMITQTLSNATVPNCQPVADSKDAVIQRITTEKKALEGQVNTLTVALKTCQEQKSSEDKACPKCTSELRSITRQYERVKVFESEVKHYKVEKESWTKKFVRCQGEVTTLTGRFEETRRHLIREEQRAKCNEHKHAIAMFKKTLISMSVKAQLLQKCESSWTSIKTEKRELIHQLKKMTWYQNKLNTCHQHASENMKRCGQDAANANHRFNETINKLARHIRQQHKRIVILSEEAKCKTEQHKILEITKEVTITKVQTVNMVGNITVQLNGCKAGLNTAQKQVVERSEDATKCHQTLSTVSMKLGVCKASHGDCNRLRRSAKKECAKILNERNRCVSRLQATTNHLNNMRTKRDNLRLAKKLLKEKLAVLREKKLDLEKRLQETNLALQKETANAISLKKELEAALIKVANLVQKKKDLKAKISHLRSKIQSKKATIDTLRSSLGAETSAKQTAIQQLQTLHTAHTALQVEKGKVDGELKGLQEQLNAVNQTAILYQSKYAESSQTVANLTKMVSQISTEHHATKILHAKTETELKNKAALFDQCSSELKSFKAQLDACNKAKTEIQVQLAAATEKAKCLPYKAVAHVLRRNIVAVRVVARGLRHSRMGLQQRVSSLKARLGTWGNLIINIKNKLKVCRHNHFGCRSNTHLLRKEMLTRLRAIKGHVSQLSACESQLAGRGVELVHTRRQYRRDKKGFKGFKDNLLRQMARLIGLARKAKAKFDTARVAMHNQLKIQDGQFGSCRTETLQYKTMLGAGVIKAQWAKMQAFAAVRRAKQLTRRGNQMIHNASAKAAKLAAREAAIAAAQKKLDALFKKVQAKMASSSSSSTSSSNASTEEAADIAENDDASDYETADEEAANQHTVEDSDPDADVAAEAANEGDESDDSALAALRSQLKITQ